MKYFLIYTISAILIGFIWFRGFEIPHRVEKKELLMDRELKTVLPPPPPPTTLDTTYVYIERYPTNSNIDNKGWFDYLNEILTMIIGVINIITFGYQMKDRKIKINENRNHS